MKQILTILCVHCTWLDWQAGVCCYQKEHAAALFSSHWVGFIAPHLIQLTLSKTFFVLLGKDRNRAIDLFCCYPPLLSKSCSFCAWSQTANFMWFAKHTLTQDSNIAWKSHISIKRSKAKLLEIIKSMKFFPINLDKCVHFGKLDIKYLWY